MATLQKIHGNYYGYFYNKHREPKRKSVPLRVSLKSSAKKKLHRLEDAYAEGTFDPWNPSSRPERLSIEEACERFLEDRRGTVKSSTVKEYGSELRGLRRRLSTRIPVSSVSAEKVRRFVYDPSVKQSTKAKHYRHVKAFFNWALEEDLIEESPLDDFERPKDPEKVPEYLTRKQVRYLLDVMDQYREAGRTKSGPTPEVQWLKELTHIGLATGLRRSALAEVRWSDIDFENDRLIARNRDDEGHTSKSWNEDSIPLVTDAKRTFEEIRQRRSPVKPSARVLRSATGLPLHRNLSTISNRFKFFLREAGFGEHLSFHSLRHTCATWLAAKGVPAVIIKEILGHSTIAVTERYMHAASDRKQQYMEDTFGGLRNDEA